MKINAVKKLTDLKWVNMFEAAYVDKKGRNKSWQIVSRAKEPKCITGKFAVPDAVVIAAFHVSEKKIVVTREYRVPLADYEYGFPAGLVDEGESVSQAACRELKEETGLEVIRINAISPAIYSSAGMSDESVAMVYLDCDGQPSDEYNEGSEVIEVQLISQSQADGLHKDPALKFDAKAWLVISAFAKYGQL